MRRTRDLGLGSLIAMSMLGGASGCINHYHYYTAPGMVEPAPAPGIVVGSAPTKTTGVLAYGSTCEVPRIESTSGPDRQVVIATPRPSRTIVSEPTGEAVSGSRLRPRFAWRQPEVEGPALTRFEGAVEADPPR